MRGESAQESVALPAQSLRVLACQSIKRQQRIRVTQFAKAVRYQWPRPCEGPDLLITNISANEFLSAIHVGLPLSQTERHVTDEDAMDENLTLLIALRYC